MVLDGGGRGGHVLCCWLRPQKVHVFSHVIGSTSIDNTATYVPKTT